MIKLKAQKIIICTALGAGTGIAICYATQENPEEKVVPFAVAGALGGALLAVATGIII